MSFSCVCQRSIIAGVIASNRGEVVAVRNYLQTRLEINGVLLVIGYITLSHAALNFYFAGTSNS